MKPSFAALLLLSAATWTGCEKEAPEAPKVQEVILNVRTLDTAQKPVEMVRFYINGKKFGITDQDGTFQGRHAAKDGDTLSFNVEPPDGYSVPADIDQSQWQYTVKYPADGRPLQLDFTANLQRPERDYLFMVRTPAPGTSVSVNGNLVGKTGATGDAMLRVSGTPGLAFSAEAGDLKLAGTFAEDDEVYLLTTDKAGPVNPPAVAEVAAADVAAEVPAVPGSEAVAAAEPETPPAAPATEAEPLVVADNTPPPAPEPEIAPEPVVEPPPRRVDPPPVEPARPEPPPARVERVREEPARVAVVTPPPSRNSERPAARVREPAPERPSRPARAEPTFDPTDPIDDTPPVATGRSAIKADPEPPPAERAPPPSAKRDDDLTALGLFDDDPKGGAGLDTPPPVPVPEPAADPVVLGGGSGSAKSAKADTTSVGKGELLDEEGTVNKGAINAKVAVTGGTGPSASTMDRAEVAERLDRIKGNLAQTTVLQKADVDFLSSVDRTDPGYYEANRLLADYYFRLKDYRREAESLDAATTGGRYKHDPMVLLSLAKAYAHTKDYRRALSTMKRVDAKMRNLPAAHKVDAYRVHAEMLEFEFLRQFHEDAKRANVSLVDKAIGKWENLQTFSQGADANAAALASKKIRELNELKSRVEL